MPRSHHAPPERLSDSLSAALESHLHNLNGQDCGNLYRLVLSAVEEQLVAFALKRCGGNCSEAARMLGISRTTVIRKKNASDIGDDEN